MSPEVERRRRLVTRTLPLALDRDRRLRRRRRRRRPRLAREGSRRAASPRPGRRTNFAAMYGELNPPRRRRSASSDFAIAYREAEQVATLRVARPRLRRRTPPRATARPWCRCRSRSPPSPSASFEDELDLPYADGGIDWDPSLVFPGLRAGEHLESRDRAGAAGADPRRRRRRRWPKARPRNANTRSAAPRSTSPAKSANAGEEDLERLARHGFPPDTPVGISGLEQAFNTRLAGKPGGSLLARRRSRHLGPRCWPRPKPKPGAPVKTTIDPDLQEAAVVGPGRPRRRHRRARRPQRRRPRPRRPGLLRPAAAGLDLQDRHHHRRPAEGRRLARRRIRNHRRGQRRRPLHLQRQRRVLRRHLPPGLRRVLQRDLRPARARRSATTTWSRPPSASASTRRRPSTRRRSCAKSNRPESTIPTEIGEEIDLGVSAIGQGEVLATPLQMASVAQTIANGGVREPTSIVNNKKLRPDAEPVRVMSKKIADELTELMIGVVTEGTGTAGAIPEAQVAGKTGTAELGPKPGQEERGKPDPDQGRLVRRLRPGREGEAGGRGAADRSRSRRRRSRRAGRGRSPLRRPLASAGRRPDLRGRA